MASKAGAGYEEIARRGRALSTSSTASSGCNSLSEFAFEMELDGWKHSEGWVPDSSSNARHVRESWQQTERGRSNADTVPSNDPAKISATIKSKSEATASLEAHMRLPDPIPTAGGQSRIMKRKHEPGPHPTFTERYGSRTGSIVQKTRVSY